MLFMSGAYAHGFFSGGPLVAMLSTASGIGGGDAGDAGVLGAAGLCLPGEKLADGDEGW
jgi:hypothetical protein